MAGVIDELPDLYVAIHFEFPSILFGDKVGYSYLWYLWGRDVADDPGDRIRDALEDEIDETHTH